MTPAADRSSVSLSLLSRQNKLVRQDAAAGIQLQEVNARGDSASGHVATIPYLGVGASREPTVRNIANQATRHVVQSQRNLRGFRREAERDGSSTNAIQNGAPDAIALVKLGDVIDSMEYESGLSDSVCGFSLTNCADSDSVDGSVQRCGVTWWFSSAKTPGVANNCQP